MCGVPDRVRSNYSIGLQTVVVADGSEASLRICESLDVDTVLREVVESARALTGAGCSGITTMDASGHLQDFVTAGVSPEEYQRFLHLPHGPDLWEYLRQVP